MPSTVLVLQQGGRIVSFEIAEMILSGRGHFLDVARHVGYWVEWKFIGTEVEEALERECWWIIHIESMWQKEASEWSREEGEKGAASVPKPIEECRGNAL